jgi:tetratricopeptide (TPR) repeat protein
LCSYYPYLRILMLQVANKHLNRAAKAVAARDYEGALGAYERALKVDLSCGGARIGMASVLRTLGRYEEAEVALAEQLRREPHDRDALFALGTLCELQGREDEALSFYDLALMEKQASHVLMRRGRILATRGDVVRAGSDFTRAFDLNPRLWQAKMGLGQIAVSEGRHDAAAVCFEKAAEIQQQQPEPLLELGRARRAAGRHIEAMEAYRKALQLVPDDPDATYGLGLAAYDAGEYDVAVPALTTAARFRPDASVLHRMLGDIAMSRGQHGVATAEYSQALEERPDDTASLLGIARVYDVMGRTENAIEASRKAATECGSGEAAVLLTILLARTGEYAEALSVSEVALVHAPKNERLAEAVGTSLLRTGRSSDAHSVLAPLVRRGDASVELLTVAAEAALESGHGMDAAGFVSTALGKQPGRPDLLILRARATLATGHTGRAISDLEEAARINPNNTEMTLFLASCYRLTDRPDLALSTLDRIRVSCDSDSRLHVERARLLEALEEFDEAEAAFSSAVSRKPDDPEALYGLGARFLARGAHGAAADRLKRAVRSDADHIGAWAALARAYDNLDQQQEARTAWETYVATAERLGATDGVDEALTWLKTH